MNEGEINQELQENNDDGRYHPTDEERYIFEKMGKHFCLDVNLAYQKFMKDFEGEDVITRLLVSRSVYAAFVKAQDDFIAEILKKHKESEEKLSQEEKTIIYDVERMKAETAIYGR